MRNIGKIITLFLLIFSIPGCNFFHFEDSNNNTVTELGSLTSGKIWIYLCGLTKNLSSAQEVENRNILNNVGKDLNIKILAIKPKERCSEFDNKLCWPHNSHEQTLNTYSYIKSIVKNIEISGFIGFSNGGFFLNKLAQIMELNKPIISIGSAGYLADTTFRNNIYLLIGKQDRYHYSYAQEFYNKSIGTPLHVILIEYDKGHEIPETVLENILGNLILDKKVAI